MSKLLEKARAEHEQRKAVNESKQKLMERQLRLFQLVEDRRKQAEELAKHREETEGSKLNIIKLLNQSTIELKKQFQEVNELIDSVNKDCNIDDPSKVFEKSKEKLFTEEKLDKMFENFEPNLNKKLQGIKETVKFHETDSVVNKKKIVNENTKKGNANFSNKTDEEEEASETEELEDIYNAEHEKCFLRNSYLKNNPVEQVENILHYSINKRYKDIDKLSGFEKDRKINEKHKVDDIVKRTIGEFRKSARQIFEADTFEDDNGRVKDRPPPLCPKDLFGWESPDFKKEYEEKYDEKLVEMSSTSGGLGGVNNEEPPKDYFSFLKRKMEKENFKF